jgi:membrane fusion protein (multidrug efflux system)
MTSQAEKKKKPVRNIVLGIIAVVAVIAGIPTFLYYHHHETTDDAQVEGHILPVMPRVGGYVDKVYVLDDQPVKAGDTLFTLDRSELEIKARQAEADLLVAQAGSGQGIAGAGVGTAQAQKTAAQANLEAAQANLDRAKQDVERTRQLSAEDIASKAQLDAAEATYRSAQATLDAAADQARGSAFNSVGANAQVKAADARLEAAQAQYDAAQLQLSYTVITADASGHIAKKNIESGQWVSAGQPVLSIVDDSLVWVIANLKETQLDHVREGELVNIQVDAYPGLHVHGKVGSIQYATGARFTLLPPDNATGNYTKVVQRVPVHIDLTDGMDSQTPLRPGMSVGVSIDTRTAE